MSEATAYFTKHYRTIKKRECYQVGYTLYRTPRAAAKAQAWNLILTKYLTWPGTVNKLSEVKSVMKMECNCCADYFGEYSAEYGHEACPLHDRYTGYFARLHKRLAGLILKSYEIQLTKHALDGGESAPFQAESTPEVLSTSQALPKPTRRK